MNNREQLCLAKAKDLDIFPQVGGPSGKFIRVTNTVEQSAFGKAVHRKQPFGAVK